MVHWRVGQGGCQVGAGIFFSSGEMARLYDCGCAVSQVHLLSYRRNKGREKHGQRHVEGMPRLPVESDRAC